MQPSLAIGEYLYHRICHAGTYIIWHSVSGWVVAPSVLNPSDGVFGRFDLVALCGCHTLNVCLFVCLSLSLLFVLKG
jgi:hypothetical protein